MKTEEVGLTAEEKSAKGTRRSVKFEAVDEGRKLTALEPSSQRTGQRRKRGWK